MAGRGGGGEGGVKSVIPSRVHNILEHKRMSIFNLRRFVYNIRRFNECFFYSENLLICVTIGDNTSTTSIPKK